MNAFGAREGEFAPGVPCGRPGWPTVAAEIISCWAQSQRREVGRRDSVHPDVDVCA
eukprot:CAMPEP_0198492080 /NCGR_PEP_ID=MMETSP1462-20131121/3223_1 /TAXON_ID=1333877 /ORGANISM="Brandtodinium nutriculum, Strain RCC3387" /LENGTH=55 /DNA_ID=CAMNT_0044220715 /DNA_START=299 /DNA_END=462 /DNA_ORIENTATION=+